MRAVLQRVLNASVEVDGALVASIGRGLLVLAGLHESDTERDMEYIAGKIIGARIFDDADGAMKPDEARQAFSRFVEMCTSLHRNTRSGIFGADMKVSLVNDGPVTILVDSERRF